MRRNAAELAGRLAPHTPTARPSIAARFGKIYDIIAMTRGKPAHASANALASRGFASAAAAKPQRRKAKEPDTDAAAPLRMKFATGLSKNEDLGTAVVEAIEEVKSALGHNRPPTWLQLMVSADYKDPSLAPAYALDCFTTTPKAGKGTTRGKGKGITAVKKGGDATKLQMGSLEPAAPAVSTSTYPALFGGVVTGCIGGRGQTMDGPSVSVTAACMPGVDVIPFHALDCSLPPQVTAAQWLELMTAGGMSQGGAAHHKVEGVGVADTDVVRADADDTRADRYGVRVAANKGSVDSVGDAAVTNGTNAETPETVGVLMLADPHFVEVDSFMRRFHSVLPASKVVGGAVKAGEALFSGGAVHSGGAAGIIMRGRFGMEAHSLHAYRPVGPAMNLTAATEGVIIDLDGRPAERVITKVLDCLPDVTKGLPIMIGVGPGDGGRGDAEGADGRGVRALRGRAISAEEMEASAAKDSAASRKKSTPITPSVSLIEVSTSPDGTSITAEEQLIAIRAAIDAAKLVLNNMLDPLDQYSSEGSKAAEAKALAQAEADYGRGGTGYVFITPSVRDIFSTEAETGGVFIDTHHKLEEGAPVQLHVRDTVWGKQRAADLMDQWAGAGAGVGVRKEEEGKKGKAKAKAKSTPDSTSDSTSDSTLDFTSCSTSYADHSKDTLAGAVMYTCVEGNRMEAANFRERVPGVALGGGYMTGELGPVGPGSPSYLHSYTSMVGLFWDLGGAAAAAAAGKAVAGASGEAAGCSGAS